MGEMPDNQYLADELPAPVGERMPADPRLFSLDDQQGAAKTLVRGVREQRRALQRSRRARAAAADVVQPQPA